MTREAEDLFQRAEDLRARGRHLEAIKAYETILQTHPDFPEALNNLGNMLVGRGAFEKAQSLFSSALGSRPDDPVLLYNLASLRFRQMPLVSWDGVAAQFLSRPSLPANFLHELNVRSALAAYARFDVPLLKSFLNVSAKLCLEGYCVPDANHANLRAYERYLKALPEPQPLLEASPLQQAALVGDSHILSYLCYAARADLVMAGKAFHLASPEPNAYQRDFEIALDRLSSGCDVYLSFGEIDCRLYEGFLPHYRKEGGVLKDQVELCCRAYVDYVMDQTSKRKLNPFFLNIPAPALSLLAPMDQGMSPSDKNDLIIVVATFNEILAQAVKTKGAGLVDFYGLTADEEGVADGQFHIDQHHLRPSVLPLLFKL